MQLSSIIIPWGNNWSHAQKKATMDKRAVFELNMVGAIGH